MPEPLTVNKPFPTTEGITPDSLSIAIISPAYASPTGELNALLQYFYHYFNFNKAGYVEYAKTLESIAIAEMLHVKILGELITALGATAVYCQNPPTAFNFYSTKYVTYSRDFKYMIEDDIASEERAVSLYTRMLSKLKNDAVIKIVSRIKEDEILHLEKLKEILGGFKR